MLLKTRDENTSALLRIGLLLSTMEIVCAVIFCEEQSVSSSASFFTHALSLIQSHSYSHKNALPTAPVHKRIIKVCKTDFQKRLNWKPCDVCIYVSKARAIYRRIYREKWQRAQNGERKTKRRKNCWARTSREMRTESWKQKTENEIQSNIFIAWIAILRMSLYYRYERVRTHSHITHSFPFIYLHWRLYSILPIYLVPIVHTIRFYSFHTKSVDAVWI